MSELGAADRVAIERRAAVIRAVLAARGQAERTVRPSDLAAMEGGNVAITGAAGSIGSRLVEALLAQTRTTTVLALDHDDTALQRLVRANASPRLVPWLADVRDEVGMRAALEAASPSLVVHAAAIKHSDLLERCPREGLRTNVLGTRNVALAAGRIGARLVNVSTDKAATPDNVLGASKRLAERVVAAVAAGGRTAAVSVRLGNVLDSRGSVVEAFLGCVDRGQRLPVTGEAMTRLCTTMNEVVAFLLRAAACGANGDVLVLPLGRPVSVGELARFVLAATASSVGTCIVGPRPGDADSQELVGADERASACCECGTWRIGVGAWHDVGQVDQWLGWHDTRLAAALCEAARGGSAVTREGGVRWAAC